MREQTRKQIGWTNKALADEVCADKTYGCRDG